MDTPPVQYVRTSDGFNIAYRVTGAGTPCVVIPPILHHLEFQAPANRRWMTGLGQHFKLVEYDARGQGLSTRGLPENFSMEDLRLDVEAVFEGLELDRAILKAVGTSAHTAIRFAVRHPRRVLALVLNSASLVSGPWWPASLAESQWDDVLAMFASSQGSYEAVAESKQRLSRMLTQQDGVRLFRASRISRIDNELPRLTVPVLVLHPREVQRPSLDECAELVALIPGARLVEISGGWPLLDGDFDSALPFIERFLTERLDVVPPAKRDEHSLSARELDVLRLLTVGRSNRQVANELVISLSTVAKHVTSILDKTGAANRTEAAVYARDHGLA